MKLALVLLILSTTFPLHAGHGGDGSQSPARATTSVVPFPPSMIRLLPGPMESARVRNREYVLSLDPERLLHNFRQNAGLPSRAVPLGGWEKPDCELRGHFVGHYLTACALIVEATGDTALQHRGEAVVAGLAACQQALGRSGYLSAFPEEFIDRVETGRRVWAPWYTLHKIYRGLLDMERGCGSRTAGLVLDRAMRWVKERIDRLDDSRMQEVLKVEFGGMGEVLADYAAARSDSTYLALARRFEKRSFMEPLFRREDRLRGLHANTHIPQVIAAARLFELTGDNRYRLAVEYFWDQIVDARSYVTGGTSNYEGWRFEPGTLAGELSDESHENCCTYNMLRLSRFLTRWEPTVERADYYERALLNGILPTQHPDTGAGIMYYVPMVSGLFKMFGVPDSSYWCCTGTGIESFATLTEGIYYRDLRGIFVNQFVPSSVRWSERGVTVRQESRYPEDQTVRFTVFAAKPTEFVLRIRIPGWLGASPAVAVNGKWVNVHAVPGTYASIGRTWKNRDRVQVTFPMDLRLAPLPGDTSMVAIVYGPVVLAGALGKEGMSLDMQRGFGYPDVERMFSEGAAVATPVLVPPSPRLRDWIVPAGGKPLTFETTGAGRPRDVLLLPFSKLFGQRYALYWERRSEKEWTSDARWEFRAGLVDTVRVGDPQSQREHNFQASRFQRGDSGGSAWVMSPHWLRYDMNVEPDTPMALSYVCGGADSTMFEILIDGIHLVTPVLKGETPGSLVARTVPISAELIAGRRRIAVMFRGIGGKPTPRLYGCATTKQR